MTESKASPIEQIEQYGFPRGSLFTWDKDHVGAVSLRYLHDITVIISGNVITPIEFMGSFDGKSYELIRDADGDAIRIRRSGVYCLPSRVRMIQPVFAEDFTGTIQIFIEE